MFGRTALEIAAERGEKPRQASNGRIRGGSTQQSSDAPAEGYALGDPNRVKPETNTYQR